MHEKGFKGWSDEWLHFWPLLHIWAEYASDVWCWLLLTFFCLAATEKTNDSVAIHKTSISAWALSLHQDILVPQIVHILFQNIWLLLTLVPNITVREVWQLHVFLSQLCNQIEMAFGPLVTKWYILHTTICCTLSHLNHLLNAVCRLHNFCINSRESDIVSREGISHLREPLADCVYNSNLSRPKTVITKRALEQLWNALYTWTASWQASYFVLWWSLSSNRRGHRRWFSLPAGQSGLFFLVTMHYGSTGFLLTTEV